MSIVDFLDNWSNAACIGYAIQAMEGAGLPPDKIQQVLDELERAFDELTVQEAEKICYEH